MGHNIKSDLNTFILRARTKHGDLYDYSKSVYTGSHKPLIVTCRIHGDFEVVAIGHYRSGYGCKSCFFTTRSSKAVGFIEACMVAHGNRYDYSETVYAGAKNKIKIGCPSHGIFEQAAGKHKEGMGCFQCFGVAPVSIPQFIERSVAVHGDRYDYSKVDFVKTHDRIAIICKTHGEFTQEAGSHMGGQGCRKCNSVARTYTTEIFVEKAKGYHGDLYDYSKTVYRASSKNVIIICKVHGEFTQSPNAHLIGRGCRECAFDVKRHSLKSFLTKATARHGNRYDYSRVTTIEGSRGFIQVGCSVHGVFRQSVNGHLLGSGCKRCYFDSRLDTHEEFISKAVAIHGDRYDYSQTTYVDRRSKVIIGCKVHGIFKQIAGNHAKGGGCAKCNNSSIGEEFIRTQLTKMGIAFEEQKSYPELQGRKGRLLKYDFYLPDLNTLLEFDGMQHSNEAAYIKLTRGRETFANINARDAAKNTYAKAKGITLIRIPYTRVQKIPAILKEILNDPFLEYGHKVA